MENSFLMTLNDIGRQITEWAEPTDRYPSQTLDEHIKKTIQRKYYQYKFGLLNKEGELPTKT